MCRKGIRYNLHSREVSISPPRELLPLQANVGRWSMGTLPILQVRAPDGVCLCLYFLSGMCFDFENVSVTVQLVEILTACRIATMFAVMTRKELCAHPSFPTFLLSPEETSPSQRWKVDLPPTISMRAKSFKLVFYQIICIYLTTTTIFIGLCDSH